MAHSPQGEPLHGNFSFAPAQPRNGRGESVAYVRGQHKLVGRDKVKGVPLHLGNVDAGSIPSYKAGWSSRESCKQEIHETADDGSPFLLYDLEKDPSERHDLSREMPELLERLIARVDELGQSAWQTPRSYLYGNMKCVAQMNFRKAFEAVISPHD